MSEATPSRSTLERGDLVTLDYEVWAEGPDHPELVDTTRPEAAAKADAKVSEGTTLEPRPHLVGGEYFPKAIEDALVGAPLGETIAREFPPAEAFGERDPRLIELFSHNEIARLPEMRKEDADLHLGTVLTIRGRRGRVVTITAGRIRVDFNPELAGRKIRVEMRAVARIDGEIEKARAIVDLVYGHGKEFEVRHREGTLTLTVPDRSKFDLNWAVAKPRLIEQLRQHLKPKAIHLLEEYVTPPATPPSAPPPAAPTTAPPAASAPTETAPAK